MKNGRLIFLVHVNAAGLRFGLLGGLTRSRSRRQPRSRPQPGFAWPLQRAAYGEQAQGSAGSLRLVHGSGIKRHGYGRCFISAGVVKLPVDHDDDRNQMAFAVGRQLEQRERARSLVGLWSPGKLRGRKGRQKQRQRRQRDGAPAVAI